MDYKDMNAIGVVRLMLTDGVITEEQAAKYFPELKESEDERIKKEIISHFKETIKNIRSEEIIPHSGKVLIAKMQKWIAWFEKQGEQKHADSPKGEDYGIDGLFNAIRILEKTLGKVDGYQTDDGILEHECAISAVKSLYEQKSAWSEEDEEMIQALNVCINAAIKGGMNYISFDSKSILIGKVKNWLKSLKNRVQPQPKQEWSEEDKKIIDRIESEFLAQYRGDYHNIDFNDVDKLTVLTWARKIKSLCFQSRWKPTEEQITWLYRAVNMSDKDSRMKQVLSELLGQLKAL